MLQSQFSSQHLKVGPEERDQQLLVDDFLPITVSMRKCMHCGLCCVAEPNTSNLKSHEEGSERATGIRHHGATPREQ